MPRATIDTAGWTWSAVAIGVVASLIVQVLLTMLGFGIGLVGADTTSSATGMSWAAFGWWAISGIIAAFVAGWVAGAFSPTHDRRLKAAGGLAAWAVATLLVIGATGLAAGTAGTVASALSGPVAGAGQRLQDATGSPRRETTGQAAGQPSLETARKQLSMAMLASFVALLLGAGAAYAGGSTAMSMPGRETKT
jgi:MFS family permease